MKGGASQNDFNICSRRETTKVTLFLEQPSHIECASEISAPIFLAH